MSTVAQTEHVMHARGAAPFGSDSSMPLEPMGREQRGKFLTGKTRLV